MIPVQPPQGQPLPQGAAQPPQGPSQQQPVTIDAVMALLRDGIQRRFRIDIETDSTVAGDESQERSDRTQFIEATTKFIEAWGPIVQQQPIMSALAGELLLFGTRAFRVGRSLEEVIEETVDKLDAHAAMPKPPPQPSPDELVKLEGVKTKTAAEGQKAAMSVQGAAQDAQAKEASAKLELAGKVMDHQHKTAEHHMDVQAMHTEAALEAEKLRLKAIADQRAHNLKLEQMAHAAKQAKQPKGNE